MLLMEFITGECNVNYIYDILDYIYNIVDDHLSS